MDSFPALFHSTKARFHMSVCPSFATLTHVTAATLSNLLLGCVFLILRNFIRAGSLLHLHHNNIPIFCLGCALPRRKMNSDQDTPPQSASSISQPGALHPNRLPPRPEKGAKERTARSAQEVLEEYKECSFDEKMCM